MIQLLLTGLFALIILTAVAAPLESLGWWAGWFGERGRGRPQDDAHPLPSAPPNSSSHYLIYLSGIGAITDDSLPKEELAWLAALEPALPGTELVRDVFPYSVTNVGLTGNRVFARVYRRLERLRLKNEGSILAATINLRNMFQVLVSADPRYGPIYSKGVADAIVDVLQRLGYRVGSGTPVTLLGWSGGAQVALGTVSFLSQLLRAPIRVVSIGGLLSDDPGLRHITHVYHFYGDRDPIQAVGSKIYAGRWRMFPQSNWNRAMAQGKIDMVSLGPLVHNGTGNYFDWTTRAPDGRPYAQVTIDAICAALRRDGLLDERSPGVPPARA